MDNATYSHIPNETHSQFSHIQLNCRENWPIWTCIVANIAGFVSTAMWLLVQIPQLWKNFKRKSVRGISILWATANFTASIINIFFVFVYVKIPLYAQITSVYCPVMEFGLMLQFWAYGDFSRKVKMFYAAICFVVWGGIIALEMSIKLGSVLEYAAIALWSVETFPQVQLNMRRRSTKGLSTISVVIASIGKTSDFIATNGLVMPIQYVIMRYFSSTVSYINSLQVAWYLGNGDNVISGGCCKQDDSSKNANRMSQQSLDKASGNDSSLNLQADDSTPAIQVKPTPLKILIRWICLLILTFLLIGCVVGFVWNIDSYYGLLAPAGIICYLGMTKLYIMKCKRRSFVMQNAGGNANSEVLLEEEV